jgi:hypothetical protein
MVIHGILLFIDLASNQHQFDGWDGMGWNGDFFSCLETFRDGESAVHLESLVNVILPSLIKWERSLDSPLG